MEAEVLANPVTGELMTVLESTPEAFRVRYSLAPRSSIASAHYHPSREQRVSVLAGEMHMRIDGVHQVLRAGESMTVPAGARHDQWNPGDIEVIAVEELRPAGRTHEMFAVLFGLATDGKTDSSGYPSPLFSAAFLSEYGDCVQPAPLTARLILRALSPLAGALGYRRKLERYRPAATR